MNDWLSIDTAPFDQDLELAVIDQSGEHGLVFPCRRALRGWIKSDTGEPVDVHPTHWREWLVRVRLWRKECRCRVDPSELATLVLCELTDEAAEFFDEWTDKELEKFDTDNGLDMLIEA